MITAFRIIKRQHAAQIWTGAGAQDHGGRWNSKGVAVVYTAQSRALAALEQLVHLVPPRVLRGYLIASITFDSQTMTRTPFAKLPKGWNDPVAPASLKRIGDEWVAACTWPVLRVPSVVIAGEWNYLINSRHAQFEKMRKSRPRPFTYDPRLR